MDLFFELEEMGYQRYLEQNPFHLELGVSLDKYNLVSESIDISSNKIRIREKISKNIWSSVDPENLEPYPVELDDLIRLHYLVTSRRVTTVMEFGVGLSTIVFDHALQINKEIHSEYVLSELRRSNPFECHSVDNSPLWVDQVKKRRNFENTFFYITNCKMGTFNDRICTYYEVLPNICPDLIYLDGPDLHSTEGTVRGVSTRSKDRVPMAGDILSIEHFLLPGTVIVVDGRTANARFLRTNLQRNWSYSYFEQYDQHVFELTEEPLGAINAKHLDFLQRK
jgi:hypothetical protein